MRDYFAMSRREAAAYLEDFLGENAAAVAALRTAWLDSGEDPKVLDGSPDSLEPLWRWARPRLRRRDGWVPPGPDGVPVTRYSLADLQPVDELPSWFWFPSGLGLETFSPETVWLIDGIARYFADTVLAAVPDARWSVGRSRVRGYYEQNMPVLTGVGHDPVSPIVTVVTVTVMSFRGDRRGSDTGLRESLDALVASAANANDGRAGERLPH